MRNCEYVLFVRKGKAKYINNIGASKTVHRFNNIIGNKKHPTEKPVELLEFYINNSSKEGDLVIDPFSGSGATGIACINTNRKFVLIEKESLLKALLVKQLRKHTEFKLLLKMAR